MKVIDKSEDTRLALVVTHEALAPIAQKAAELCNDINELFRGKNVRETAVAIMLLVRQAAEIMGRTEDIWLAEMRIIMSQVHSKRIEDVRPEDFQNGRAVFHDGKWWASYGELKNGACS